MAIHEQLMQFIICKTTAKYTQLIFKNTALNIASGQNRTINILNDHLEENGIK